MRTTDNNGGKLLVDLVGCNNIQNSIIEDLSYIANKSLLELQKNNPDLLIFPKTLGEYNDNVEKSYIFSFFDEKITTYNLMGFIGRNDTQITINSRFSRDDQHDYFLHYMLQRVFSINLFKFDQTPNNENIWDFLLYLFPYYLKKAYSQGIFKAYKKEEYNDSNVKGAIDVKRHILMNTPFIGKIAYTTREYSYDNNLTQLIRHTIEHIKVHPFGSGVLTNDSELRDIVNKIIFITDKTYNRNSRQKIISANLKTISHPYFTEYATLQKICIKILRHDKITFGTENNKIYGLLFDGAWLWEEYLNTLLKDKFTHPRNITGENGFYLFENFQKIYPDFISNDNPKKVADAKYIPLDRKEQYHEDSEKATSIYYKTITYMYRFSSNLGYLFFPYSMNDKELFNETYKIKNTSGTLKKIGLAIPQNTEKNIEFNEFIETMHANEQKFLNAIE
jgi:5-methylcytosine-specific restriction enzyme subunit McrC